MKWPRRFYTNTGEKLIIYIGSEVALPECALYSIVENGHKNIVENGHKIRTQIFSILTENPKYRQIVISVQIQYKIRVLCPKIMIPKSNYWLKWPQIS